MLVPAIADGPGREIVRFGRFAIYPTTLVAIGVMVLLTWSNDGAANGQNQNVFTAAKILALAGLIGLCLLVGGFNASPGDFWKATFTAPVARGSAEYTTTVLTSGALLLAIGTAMVGSLFRATHGIISLSPRAR